MLVYLLALVIGIVASARITRLMIFDHYPPVVWVRITWDKYTGSSPWNLLLHCGYCLAPWVTLAVGALAVWQLNIGWSTVASHWWWSAATWLAASYAASIVVAYDGDD